MPDHPEARFPDLDLTWISNRMWSEVCKLSLNNSFDKLYESFYDQPTLMEYKKIYDSLSPQNEQMPAMVRDKFT